MSRAVEAGCPADGGVSVRALEARLMARLADYRDRRSEDPAFNPIWRLACDLSFQVEAGGLGRGDLCRLADQLLARALDERGAWMGHMLGSLDADEQRRALAALMERETAVCDADSFAARWGRPWLGLVLTAHPTFLLNDSERARVLEALARVPEAERTAPAAGAEDITLDQEHARAVDAMAQMRRASATLVGAILDAARTAYPDRWRALRPQPVDTGTWVGYDMDGRTDIGWADCVRFRLAEKAIQLGWYLDDIAALRPRLDAEARGEVGAELDAIAETLAAAKAHAETARDLFADDLSAETALARAADWLTEDRPGRLVSLDPLLDRLDALVEAVEDSRAARDLAVLRAQMASFRLGIGRIHFRINATQLNNAIRRRIERDEAVDLASRSVLAQINELAETVTPLRVNFAALAVEPTTAVRQILTIAQIVKHIDADSDIRLLIAECERPATVMAALYFVRAFGVAGRVDISPLFETATALEGAERMLGVLFAQSSFRQTVLDRGRIAIESGFSDAGRFIGQIPAALAIERLHANLARQVAAHDLGAVECLVFDTHGESMGRGAHPGSLGARLDYVMSPWARAQFVRRGLALRQEVSFQGGDGYLWFARPDTALGFLVGALAHLQGLPGPEMAEADPFYGAPDLTLDMYRRIMRYQEAVMEMPAYHRTLTAFAPALLKSTGSRKSRRQFETGRGERPDLSRLRAIPHNAVLQQLGFPINVIAGLGEATRPAREVWADWRTRSARFATLMDLVVEARERASLRTMTAYLSVFDAGYWASRPHSATQAHLTDACLYLAERLDGDDRTGAGRALTGHLRIDELLLHQFLGRTGEDKAVMDATARDTLALLHSLRIALIQHLFLMAARIPRFSARNDISRADIMELIFALRVPEAVALLRQAFPGQAPGVDDFVIAEPADYPDADAPNYTSLNRALIDPMEQIHRCLLTISVAVANCYRAHG
ncbi:hypothetical protein CCR85_11915 [Rhodothalassium salexigens]|uniref:phosphoenolpyruvate carboxylase n=1 Tax=Rhodothalassium salexigens TaxID=1086 RepID=UPI0019148060|nr:hypothetical protein [Rhodothalassium salexigens]MBK5919936.1 hypothetical protein [Rhodothalassium salexigens]